MWRTIGIVLATMLAVAAMLLGGVAVLVYAPENSDNSTRQKLVCGEERHSVMCVIQGYLMPSEDEE